MKNLPIVVAAAIALSALLTPAVFANQSTPTPSTAQHPQCTGDAAKSTPPIPNNPTHIRNVIWRSMRARCT